MQRRLRRGTATFMKNAIVEGKKAVEPTR